MKKNKAMNFSLNCPPFNAGIACRAFAAFALGGLLLMAPSVAFADGMEQNVLQQQGTVKVTGVIKDIAGEPVIGANVVVKGTTNGFYIVGSLRRCTSHKLLGVSDSGNNSRTENEFQYYIKR